MVFIQRNLQLCSQNIYNLMLNCSFTVVDGAMLYISKNIFKNLKNYIFIFEKY